jgi:hypothetical protein
LTEFPQLLGDSAGRPQRCGNHSLEIDYVAASVPVDIFESARGRSQRRIDLKLRVSGVDETIALYIAGAGLA